MGKLELIYDAPKDENNNPYYVPVVVKNRDYLLAYVDGITYMQTVADMIFESLKIPISINGFDLNLGSTKYNDVLPDGTRTSSLSDEELKTLIEKKVKEKAEFEQSRKTNPENKIDILDPEFFTIECSNCGGYYAFKEPNEIPDENFICGICDRILIHYTGHDDAEYIYDEEKKDG